MRNGILAAEQGISPNTRPRRRRLSARRVKALIAIGQCWQEYQGGTVWSVRNIWRVDRRVQLQSGGQIRVISFAELGRRYRLIEDEAYEGGGALTQSDRSLGKLEPDPTPAQRIALIGVRNGAVRLSGTGNRIYPSESISGNALTACFNREWCAWDMDKRVAYVTLRGLEALR